MEETRLYCSRCGAIIDENEDYEEVNGEIVCTECYERHTTTCERCGTVIWCDDSYGDEYTTLCHHCYHHRGGILICVHYLAGSTTSILFHTRS